MINDGTHPEADAPLLPEGEVLRLNEWEQGLLFLIAGFSVFLVLVLFVFGPSHHSNLRGPLRPVLGVIWLAIAALFFQSGRAGLIVGADGIELRTIFRRRHWRWQEVKSFEIRPAIFVPLLRIELVQGRPVRAPGFRGRSASERELAERRVAELNRRAKG